MTAIPLAEDPLEMLVAHIIAGMLNASAQGVAVIGWLCDYQATEPIAENIIATSDGWLMARHADGVEAEFLGPHDGFYDPIRLVGTNCGLSKVQANKVEGIIICP